MGTTPSHPQTNEELPNTKEKGFSSIYRKKNVAQLRSTPEPSIRTLNDMIANTVNKYGEKRGVGKSLLIQDT